MSSRNNLSFEDALNQMAQVIELEFIDITAKLVQETSKSIALGIQVAYDDFFAELLDIVMSKLDDAPAFIERYLPEGDWADISVPWHSRKGKAIGMPYGSNWHYNGLTGKRKVESSRLDNTKLGATRIKRRPTAAVKVGSFINYIRSLQSVGTTEKFFGPVTLQYEFQAPTIGHKITAKMGVGTYQGEVLPNMITSIKNRTQAGTFGKFPSNLGVTANIEAFGVLKGIKQTEWWIVDYIIKRIDTANEKQWVKINGTRKPGAPKFRQNGQPSTRRQGNGRPIKPLILPLVQYYINEALPKAMRDNVKAANVSS